MNCESSMFSEVIPVVLGLGSNSNFNNLNSIEILSLACKDLKSLFLPKIVLRNATDFASGGVSLSVSEVAPLSTNSCVMTVAESAQLKTVFSSVYRTKAMYVTDQNDFYNMAVLGFVDKNTSPYEFLNKIHTIEARYGRDRSKEIRFGPRSLDIDIELFGKLKIDEEDLTIPHPRLSEREFVLIPMLEILKKSADCIDTSIFAGYLKNLKSQNLKPCISSQEFSEKYLQEAVNGNNQTSAKHSNC